MVETADVLVGRGAELDRLLAVLHAAEGAAPRVVVLRGEAGVGKSRLLHEFLVTAQRAGSRTLLGHCIDAAGTGGPALAPVMQMLRRLARADDPVLRWLPPWGHAELARLFGSRAEAPVAVEPATSARLFELVLLLLDLVGGADVAVLAIEDVQWADRATQSLLLFLSRNLVRERALVVVTYRDDGEAPGWLGALVDGPLVDAVEVAPLAGADLAEHLRRLGAAPTEADDLARRAGGNPLYAEELLGAAQRGDPALPRQLRELFSARIHGTSPTARRVLDVAAAVSGPLPHALLAAVAGVDDATLREAVGELVGRRVLEADEDGYRFRHDLLREHAATVTLPGDRRWVHAALARTITGRPQLAAGLASGRAAAVARHWSLAGDAERASAAALPAAAEAEALGAWGDAYEWYARAVGGAADPGRVHELAARAALLDGHADDAVEHARRAVDLLPETPSGRLARALATMVDALLHADRVPDATTALDRLVVVLADIPPGEDRAIACARACETLDDLGDSRAVEFGQAALADAHALGLAVVEAEALRSLAWVELRRGDPDAALAAARRGRELAAAQRSELLRARLSEIEALATAQVGGQAEAAELALRAAGEATEAGLGRVIAGQLTAQAANLMLGAGRWDEAWRLARSVIGGPALTQATAELVLALIAAWRGDLDEAEVHSRSLAQRFPGMTGLTGTGASLARANLAAVASHYPDARGEDEPDPVAVTAADDPLERLYLAAFASVAATDPLMLRRLVEHAEAAAAQLQDVPTWDAAWRPLLAHCRAEATGTPLAWADAVDAAEPWGESYWSLYARIRLAEAQLRAGEPKPPARRLLLDTRAAAERLGARPLVRLATDVARAAGLRLPARADRREPLSVREQEVLALVASGSTNGQIAARLRISKRTVETHVANLLRKLGAGNRVELALAGRDGTPEVKT